VKEMLAAKSLQMAMLDANITLAQDSKTNQLTVKANATNLR
jgi:hypothetical protein